jgi:arsenate reductase
MIKIYHNPRCGKSREALQIVESCGQPFEIVKYLDEKLTKKTILDLIKLLKIKPIQLVRVKEKIWLDNFKHQNLSDIEIIETMVKFPILIERPIVINGNQAVIGRPPVLIKAIL